MKQCWMAATLLAVFLAAPNVQAATFTLEKDAEGVTVLCDGKLFTRYIMKSGAKPMLWPIVGPTGKEMTRGYPMREPRGPEKRRSHSPSVAVVCPRRCQWNQLLGRKLGGARPHRPRRVPDVGRRRRRPRFALATPGRRPMSDVVCNDVRTMVFGADENTRWIDFRVTVTALQGPRRVRGHQGGQLRHARGRSHVRGRQSRWQNCQQRRSCG